MNSSSSIETEPGTAGTTQYATEQQLADAGAAEGHQDPLSGESGAFPVEVGVGALGAGAAGAAIGAFAGPIGALIGAAVGAIAGGLAGKEVGETTEERSPAAEARLDHAAVQPILEGTESSAPLLAAEDMNRSSTAETHLEPPVTQLTVEDTESTSYPIVTHSASAARVEDAALSAPATPATAAPEKVREGAYYRYLDRQTFGTGGDELSDWLSAEKEVLHT